MRLAQFGSNASKSKFRFCQLWGFEIHVVSQQSKENVILILPQEDVFCFFHVLRDLYCDFYSTPHINFITSEIFY